MKKEQKSAIRLIVVKIMIGTGYAISATTGAKITLLRLTKLQMPIDVTPKSVGNIFGCTEYMEMNKAQFAPRASTTSSKKRCDGSSWSMKRMIAVPAALCMVRHNAKTTLAGNIVLRNPPRIVNGISLANMAIVLWLKSPGKYFDCRAST